MNTVVIADEALPLVKEGALIKRKALERNLNRYEEEMRSFERRFGMTSIEFEKKFETGDLGDNADWFRWSFLIEAHRKTREKLSLLETSK